MIEGLRVWLGGIVLITMLISAAQVLVPEGTLRQITGFVGGLILLLVLLRPLLGSDWRQIELDFSAYERQTAETREQLEKSGRKELAGIIEEKTASYISDKAAELGQKVRVRVITETDEDGIPLPERVELEGEYSQELSRWIESEIGLGAERQEWYGRKN